MDSNSKLGQEYIPNDPHEKSPNGTLLANIIERHALIVANGSTKCSGRITRKRITKKRTEESCIDVMLFSSDMNDSFESLLIDEDRKHVLTKIGKTTKGTIVKESDHNVLVSEFNTSYKSDKKTSKLELYNIKNHECQKRFKEYTSKTNMLSSVFDSDDDINILTQRFIKKLDGCIKVNFKKVRVTNNKPTVEENLYEKMRKLKGRDDDKSVHEMNEVIKDIAINAEKKYDKVVKEIQNMRPEGGKINSQKFWKLKKAICPKAREPPTAMTDKHGNLLTNNKAIEDRAIEVFTERLKPNKMEGHLQSLEETQ